MMWFTLKAGITEEMASNLRILLALPTVMLCSGIVMTIIGLCLIAAVALLYLGKKQPMAPTVRTFSLIRKISLLLFVAKKGIFSEIDARFTGWYNRKDGRQS